MRGSGSVAIISTRAGARGSETPSISAKRPVCGHAATMTVSAPTVPRVVAAAVDRETGHRGVLKDVAAVILKRPRIALYRALGIGVSAEVKEGAADGVVTRDGHQLLDLLAVEELPPEAPRLADLGPAPGQGELCLGERDADAIRLMFGGIAEELVHLRPEPLLLEAERAVHVRGAPAVPPRGLPAHDALLQHEHVHAGAGKPPARAEAGDAAADDHDRGPLWICHD